MGAIQLTERQQEIITIVKGQDPVTGEAIAQQLSLTRAALRADLTILVMAGVLDARPRVGYSYVGRTPESVISEKLKILKVQDIKSLPNVIRDDVSVYDTIVTMFIEDVGTLFVVGEKGLLRGAVSRKDLLKVTMGKADISKIPVEVIMTRMPNIITTTSQETVLEAVRKIITCQVDSLPVVRPLEEEGPDHGQLQVVGRITKTNIAKLFLELGEGGI